MMILKPGLRCLSHTLEVDQRSRIAQGTPIIGRNQFRTTKESGFGTYTSAFDVSQLQNDPSPIARFALKEIIDPSKGRLRPS
jgi:uncharacterized protein YcbX